MAFVIRFHPPLKEKTASMEMVKKGCFNVPLFLNPEDLPVLHTSLRFSTALGAYRVRPLFPDPARKSCQPSGSCLGGGQPQSSYVRAQLRPGLPALPFPTRSREPMLPRQGGELWDHAGGLAQWRCVVFVHPRGALLLNRLQWRSRH